MLFLKSEKALWFEKKLLNDYCSNIIKKIRYLVKGDDDKIWEIDEFYGENKGLAFCEIELEYEKERVTAIDEIKKSWGDIF